MGRKGRGPHLYTTYCMPRAGKPSGPKILLQCSRQPWEADITPLPLIDRKLKPREGMVCPGCQSTHVPGPQGWDVFPITVELSSGLSPLHPSPWVTCHVVLGHSPLRASVSPAKELEGFLPLPNIPLDRPDQGLWVRWPLSVALLQNQPPRTFGAVKVKISSNWGNPRFTCLYRVRVHGSVTLPREQPN